MKRLAIAALFALGNGTVTADPSALAFPEGYRTWDHVKSMVISPGHPLYESVGGIHSIYGNPAAIDAYRSDKQFGDGSVIVFDLFEAVDKDNAIAEGARKAVIVMEKDSARFTDTDGWGYQVFDPTSKQGTIDAAGAQACHGCHVQQKAQDFVFSAWR